MTATGTLTLTGFLLARIAEDERAANNASGVRITVALDAAKPGYGANAADHRFVRVASPRRVLAECEAKRRIVELHPSTEHGARMPRSARGVDRHTQHSARS